MLDYEKVCIANIGSDHLDYHQTQRDYERSKLSILDLSQRSIPLVNYDVLEVIKKHKIKDYELLGSYLVVFDLMFFNYL